MVVGSSAAFLSNTASPSRLEDQVPAALELSLVLHQLRCGGTPQLLTLMGRGYPTRVDFEALTERYRPLLPALQQGDERVPRPVDGAREDGRPQRDRHR